MGNKRVLIIEGSPRKKGNSQLLSEAFQKGAQEAGHIVDLVRIQEKKSVFAWPVTDV